MAPDIKVQWVSMWDELEIHKDIQATETPSDYAFHCFCFLWKIPWLEGLFSVMSVF